jgi:hypothetical protein
VDRRSLTLLAALALLVSACGPAVDTGAPGSVAPTGTPFPTWPVPGNSVTAPLPTDAPSAVRRLAPLTDCGAELLFGRDDELSPIPTSPWPTTAPDENRRATDCLMAAWENGKSAQLVVSAISDEADEIYTIYRLPGDGSVQVFVRVRSQPDQATTWTRTTCKALSLLDGDVTPAACLLETPVK